MAPPKKPEADKAKKINFTLSPAMFEAFKTKCLQEGKEISKTLQGLIEMFLNNQIPTPPPVSAHIEGNDTSVIQELLSRIEILEQNQSRNDNPVIDTHSINIESTQEETTITSTQKPAIDVLPVTPMDVSPDPVKPYSVATNEVSGKVTPDEMKNISALIRIFLTREKIKQSKFVDFYNISLKDLSKWEKGTGSMSRDRYQALMNIVENKPE